MIDVLVPEVDQHDPAPPLFLSLVAQLNLTRPMAVCDDDDWLDVAECGRVAAHAHHVWRPLATATDDRAPVVLAREGPVDDDDFACAAAADVAQGRVHLVIGGSRRRLTYVLGPVAARALLRYATPLEQRLDTLLHHAAVLGELRVAGRARGRCTPRRNLKQYLPEGTIGAVAMVAVLVVLLAAGTTARRAAAAA